MSRVDIDLDDEETLLLWAAVGDLVDGLPGQWVLVSGLMVNCTHSNTASLRCARLSIAGAIDRYGTYGGASPQP